MDLIEDLPARAVSPGASPKASGPWPEAFVEALVAAMFQVNEQQNLEQEDLLVSMIKEWMEYN